MWARDKEIKIHMQNVIFTTYKICTVAEESQTLTLELEASGTGSKIKKHQ